MLLVRCSVVGDGRVRGAVHLMVHAGTVVGTADVHGRRRWRRLRLRWLLLLGEGRRGGSVSVGGRSDGGVGAALTQICSFWCRVRVREREREMGEREKVHM